MAENNWLLNASAPVTLGQEFAAAAAENGWLLNDSAPTSLGQEFAPAATEWANHDWLVGLGFIEPSAEGAFTLTAEAGSYALSGQAATLLKSKVLAAGAGSYGLSGQAANLLKSKLLAATAGSYAIAGQSASLVYVPAGAAFTLTAEAGSYAIAGQAATLTWEPIVVVVPQSGFGGGSNIWERRHDVPQAVAEQRLFRVMKALERLRKRKKPPTPSELAAIALGLEATVGLDTPHSGDLRGLAMDVRLVGELEPKARAEALAIQIARAKRIAEDIEDEEFIMMLLLSE